MSKLLVVCGPTATGKTSLAVKLAKKFNGELISADSRQVYKGMDVGTGKDHPKDTAIHLIDVLSPDEKFNVAKYYHLAWQAIEDIWKRKKLPILVGGTGFYIKAVIEGIESLGIEPDWKLRRELENLEIRELVKKLKKLDPQRLEKMNNSDRQNPRRLIRAIEIAKQYKKSKIKYKKHISKIKNVLFIGLRVPKEVLYQRIDRRVDERVEQGVIEEIKKLLKKGYSWENSVLGETIGYQEWRPLFKESRSQGVKGSKLKEEIIQKWKFDEHAYARRQMTWFKKVLRLASLAQDKHLQKTEGAWFDISQKNWQDKVEKLVKIWYYKNNAQKD